MPFPARASIFFAIIWSLTALIATLNPQWLIFWQTIGILGALIILIDVIRLTRLTTPNITRQVTGSLALGIPAEVKLTLSNPTPRAYTVTVLDDYPLTCELQHPPQIIHLQPFKSATFTYRLLPQQRGAAEFHGVHLRLHAPLESAQQYRYVPLTTPIRIYPNFAAVTKYTLLATANHLGQLGIRKLQRRGEGLEFHQLREYRAGDTLRQIDWNATARQRKLISKEYQEERDQQVVFLLDCGRRMWAQDGTLSHFDHTLNAILLLAYVALRQGDALGLMTFSGTQRWFTPRKGTNTLNYLLNTLYDLQPTLQTSDYLTAAQQLMRRHQKRSLIILISNLRDEDNHELIPAIKLLRSKHLVLIASLQEQILNETLQTKITTFNEALRYAAIQDYLQHRQIAADNLRQTGTLWLDTEPNQLAIHLVNRYLDIKRGGIL